MALSSQTAAELRDQWELLRTRLVDAADATLDEPSTLPGWTVRDLVAHLGLGLDLLTRCELLGTPGLGPGAPLLCRDRCEHRGGGGRGR